MGGRTNSFGAGNYDIWVIKLDANGNIQWQKTYGGPSVDVGRVFQISNGNYLIAGATLRVEDGKGGIDTKQTDIRVYPQRR